MPEKGLAGRISPPFFHAVVILAEHKTGTFVFCNEASIAGLA
jgi:hypothetical protein